MKKNMGTIDRFIRIASAVAIAVLYFGGVINGWLALVLGIIAAAFIITGFVSICPIYLPFGLSTRNSNKD